MTLEVEDVEIGTVKELISLKTAATNRTSVTYKNVQVMLIDMCRKGNSAYLDCG